MRRQKRNPQKHSIKMAFVFVVLVLFFIIISFALKVVSEIKKSSFDGSHRFSIEIASEGKNTGRIISFAPETSSISILSLLGNFPLQNNREATKLLHIPIDGFVFEKPTTSSSEKDIARKLQNLIIQYKNIQTNLTIIDLVRLFLFTKIVPASNYTYREISFPLPDDKGDKILSSLFTDYSLGKESLSIEIINGTQVSGLGNRLARLISNMGGNVVSVSTAQESIITSAIIYSSKLSYTVERLSKVLSIKTKRMENPALSDVVIYIGEDKLKSIGF